MPACAANRAAFAEACSTVRALWPAPLWGIARLNSPCANGEPINAPTLMPPADSPKIVTLLGSPPKAAISSRTQRKAWT